MNPSPSPFLSKRFGFMKLQPRAPKQPRWHAGCTSTVMKQLIGGMPDGVVLYRYSPPATGRSSYLMIETQSGTAAAVDPQGDLDVFLEDAYVHGSKIKHVFVTELVGDLQQDALELGDRACATVYAGAWARRSAPFMLLKDGDTFEFGRVRLQVLETPGHRLEGIVLTASDLRADAPAPYAAFTGATVLIGDVGRPDAQAADGFGPDDLAGMLYVSLRTKVLTLPDRTRLFPALESGVELPVDRPDTLGAQRRFNPGFQPMSREEFVRRVSCGLTEERSDAGSKGPRTGAMGLDEVLRLQREGAQVVDDRDPLAFASAHLAGSLNLSDTAEFGPWIGGVLDPCRAILLVTEPGRERALASRLARAGFPRTAGFMDGGLRALRASPAVMRRSVLRSFKSLDPRAEGPALVLDTRPKAVEPLGPPVRALSLPLGLLRQSVDVLSRDGRIVVCDDFPCRSSAAASFLRSRGFTDVSEVAGGLALWGAERKVLA